MQHDEMIWSIINNRFCSFKTSIGTAKSEKRQFCRHPYSVTGLCNRTSCPLANSRYATVRERDGVVTLYVKTAERSHSPKNLWEAIVLSRNYSKALAQLDEHLAHWPKALVHRNKQRLTKIHQYLLRMRKIQLKAWAGKRQRHVGINRKIEQREGRREKKALVAAGLERNIQKELVERLARGTYGDIYNFPEVPYRKALEEVEGQQEHENDEEEDEDEMEEEMDEDDGDDDDDDEAVKAGMVRYVEDLDDDDEEDELDVEDEDVGYMGDGRWGNADSGSESGSKSSQDDDDDDDDDDDTSDESDDDGESESGSEQIHDNDEHDDDESDSDSSSSDDDDEHDVEGDDNASSPRKKKNAKKKEGSKKVPPKKEKRKKEPKQRIAKHMEIEYEEEREDEDGHVVAAAAYGKPSLEGGKGGSDVAGMSW